MPANQSEAVLAAGAVLWRVTPSAGLEIALIHRPKYDDWSLPKGKLTDGEHVLTAAVREVEEETGVAARLGRPLPTQHYLVEGSPKEVRYWSAQARSAGDGAFSAGDEVDELVWLAVGDAERAADPCPRQRGDRRLRHCPDRHDAAAPVATHAPPSSGRSGPTARRCDH